MFGVFWYDFIVFVLSFLTKSWQCLTRVGGEGWGGSVFSGLRSFVIDFCAGELLYR